MGLDTGLDVVHDVGLPRLAYVEVSCSNNFFSCYAEFYHINHLLK